VAVPAINMTQEIYINKIVPVGALFAISLWQGLHLCFAHRGCRVKPERRMQRVCSWTPIIDE
jgi:hypothetical protein